MPAGKHTSVRVALAVPPKIHEQLSAWADMEGRPLASLCMYLIEKSLREAQVAGLAPKIGIALKDVEALKRELKERRRLSDIDGFESEYDEQLAADIEGYTSVETKNPESMNDKEFEEYYDDQYKDLKPDEEPSAYDMQRMAAIRASQGIGKKVGKKTRAMESSPERSDLPEAIATGAAAAFGMAVGGPVVGAAAGIGTGVVLSKREQLVADLLSILKPDASRQVVDAVKTDEDVEGLQKFIGAAKEQEAEVQQKTDELIEEFEEYEKSTKGKGKK